MRLAVISDVHGNVEALRAVLRSIRRDGIRKIICLGDLVGYYAFPAETLALIRAGGTECIMGSHDLMAIGRLGVDGREFRTRRAISWTRRKLSGPEYTFLAGLPVELRLSEDLFFLHGALDDPAVRLKNAWQFYEQSRAIRKRHPEVRVCFTGNIQQQIVEITPEGEALVRAPRDYVLRKDAFFFVNPGSVGSPADGDYRAAYVEYDTATRRASFRRTTYDRLRVMQENIRHGLTADLGISPVDYLRARAAAAARSIRTRILPGV